MTVLDVGCGSGVQVPYILKRIGHDGRLYELDYAEKMINVNKRLHQDDRITFILADVLDLPLEPESCDVVMCFACFPHLDHKSAAIKTMSRVLKPEGRLAVAHFDSSEQINRHHSETSAVMHDKLPDEREMKLIFNRAGLQIVCFTDQPGFYLIMGKKR